MFTGIIDHCGHITEIVALPSGIRIFIRSTFKDLVLGESIAVDGICLTVTDIQNEMFGCDISPETLQVTTAKNFAKDKPVNLERALQLSSRLGGHFVSGHVDQVAILNSIQIQNEFIEMQFIGIQSNNLAFILKKGSICINGVSLTINAVFENGFSVMLIPHTLAITNLSMLKKDSLANIEFDMMARIIVEQAKKYLDTRQNEFSLS